VLACYIVPVAGVMTGTQWSTQAWSKHSSMSFKSHKMK